MSHISPGAKNFVLGGFAPLRLPWLRAWWERRSHAKHKGRLIRLQEFPDWIFLFHFSFTVLRTR